MILPTLIQGQHKSSPSRYQYIKQADGSYKRVKLNVSSFSSGSSLDFVISSSFKVSGLSMENGQQKHQERKYSANLQAIPYSRQSRQLVHRQQQLQLQQEYLPDPQQEQDPQSKQQF